MGLVNFLERLTELGQTLTFTTLLKDMIKDPYEQPNEETRRAQPRGGGRLRAGASVSGELGWVRRPPSAQVLTMLGACSPQAVGVLVEAFMGVDRLCTLLLNPSLSGEWGQSWEFQASGHNLVFQRPASIQQPSQCLPIAASLE